MKCSHPANDIEDASDRASRRRRVGEVRVPLAKLGFWQPNRGGVGCCAYHAHEVASDCGASKTKLQRYQHVAIVQIPEDILSAVRNHNRDLCAADPPHAELLATD